MLRWRRRCCDKNEAEKTPRNSQCLFSRPKDLLSQCNTGEQKIGLLHKRVHSINQLQHCAVWTLSIGRTEWLLYRIGSIHASNALCRAAIKDFIFMPKVESLNMNKSSRPHPKIYTRPSTGRILNDCFDQLAGDSCV